MKLVPVKLAQIKFSQDDTAVLVAYSLGSCVGVAMWDHEFRAGGMAHVFLPHKLRDAQESLGKYGETAIPYLISGLLDMGCKRENLQAWIAGGANVIPGLCSPLGDIGAMNVRAVREALKAAGIPVAGEDLGGSHSRTMRLYIGSGKVTVCSPDAVANEI